jgi:hypothetical protein
MALARAELKKTFDNLNDSSWDASRKLKQQRGLLFEQLVHDLFETCNLLIRRSYHTSNNKSEQIDGAIKLAGRISLLEAKWVKSVPLAASDLFGFLGKVESKFTGTIGVFVSRTELSGNFLGALRSGRRQSVIVIHGNDVVLLFDPTFPVEEYLNAHLEHLGLDNSSHLPAKRFLEGRNVDTFTPEKGASESKVEEVLRKCLTERHALNLVDEYAEELAPRARVDAIRKLLPKYKSITASKESSEDSWKAQNLDALLTELIEDLPKEATDADRDFFVSLLSPDFQNTAYGALSERFADRFPLLSADERAKVEQRLQKQWEKALGEYDSENRLAVPTRALWKELSLPARKALIPYFVDILLSHRLSSVPQYRLAKLVLEGVEDGSPEAKAFKEEFIDTVRESAKSWLGVGRTDEEGLERVQRSLKDANKAIKPFIRHFDRLIETTVKDVAAKHQE